MDLLPPNEINQIDKASVQKPLVLVMPSTNYNQRPENTKIDTIIIHHTAPFSSLTKVGYFFQDVASRVSAHYTVGREGLIIQSVLDEDRAWHAGPSSWLGKGNVNDYSVGIEILNDGDGKDPFTAPQYNALIKLTAYLMKKYDVSLSRVVGHRDIAYPLGRKSDPADNFDWKLFKNKLRDEVNISKSFFGSKDNPQEFNIPISNVLSDLKSNNDGDRSLAMDKLLTVNHKSYSNEIETAFKKETSPLIKAKFFKLFEVETNGKYVRQGTQILANYTNENNILLFSVINYLLETDKDNLKNNLLEILNDKTINKDLKIAVIKAITNYKDQKIKQIIVDELKSTDSLDVKKAIIESLAKYEDKSLNDILLSYTGVEASDSIKALAIDALRITFDTKVEKRLLELLKEENINKTVLEATTWTLIRKDSLLGIKQLTEESIYNQLDTKLKIALFNIIFKLKLADYDTWIVQQFEKEPDLRIRSVIVIALGKLNTDKGFSFLSSLLDKDFDSELRLIIFKALSNSDRPEVIKNLPKVVSRVDVPYEAKLVALSTIKDKKLNNLILNLKEVLVESKNPDLDLIIEDTIKAIEK